MCKSTKEAHHVRITKEIAEFSNYLFFPNAIHLFLGLFI